MYECDHCKGSFMYDQMCPVSVNVEVNASGYEACELCPLCPECCTVRIDMCVTCETRYHPVDPNDPITCECKWCETRSAATRRTQVRDGIYWTPQEHHIVLPHVHTQVMTWMLISNRLEKNVIPMGVSTLISSYVATNIADGPKRKKNKT